MKAIFRLLPLLLLPALLVLGSTSCLMEEKVIELVLTGSTSAEYAYYDESESYDEEIVLDFSEKIGEMLEDAGVSRDEITEAHLVGAEYGVTMFDTAGHDWTVSGAISIKFEGGAYQALLDYDSESLADNLGKRLSAPLQTPGVTLINDALADFLAGQNPVLTVRLLGGQVEPDPSAADPIVFAWQIWLNMQLTVEQTLDVPDPF